MTTKRLYTIQLNGSDITEAVDNSRVQGRSEMRYRQAVAAQVGTDADSIIWCVDNLERYRNDASIPSSLMTPHSHTVWTLELPMSEVLGVIDLNAEAKALMTEHIEDRMLRGRPVPLPFMAVYAPGPFYQARKYLMAIEQAMYATVDACEAAGGWPAVLIRRPVPTSAVMNTRPALDNPLVRLAWLERLERIIDTYSDQRWLKLTTSAGLKLPSPRQLLGDGPHVEQQLERLLIKYRQRGILLWEDVTG